MSTTNTAHGVLNFWKTRERMMLEKRKEINKIDGPKAMCGNLVCF